MKSTAKILMSVCMLLFALPLAGQTTGWNAQKIAQISFGDTEYDFGRLAYKGEPRSCDFRFTNTGTAPLVITRVQLSCKCLSVSYPKKPLQPGQSATLTVTYHPKNETGKFENTIQVFSNGADRRVILVVKGNVGNK